MRALYTAATGMAAQELTVQVISNNIANQQTTGYKLQRAQFQDLLYQNVRRTGSATSTQGNLVPAGIQIGSGVKTATTARNMSQGTISSSGKDYDLAIRGEGLFKIRMPDGTAAYTRDGSFNLDAQGQIVTHDGYIVEPGITIPQTANSVTISAAGVVQVGTAGQAALQTLGTVQMSRFINKVGLDAIGDNLFVETASSGQPIDGTPTGEGFGSLQQGFLEASNVNAVTEISSLIAAQRAYEMNSKVITAADQMLSTTTQMFRS